MSERTDTVLPMAVSSIRSEPIGPAGITTFCVMWDVPSDQHTGSPFQPPPAHRQWLVACAPTVAGNVSAASSAGRWGCARRRARKVDSGFIGAPAWVE